MILVYWLKKIRILTVKFGSKIDKRKTEVMEFIRNVATNELNVIVRGDKVEEITSFRYLRSKLTRDGRCKEDIKVRMTLAKRDFFKRREILISNIYLEIRNRMLKPHV